MAKRRKEKASHGEVVEEEKGTNVFGRHKLYGLNSDFTWGSILLLAVVLTYQPIWHAGFVWDDASHLTANPCIVGPLGLKEMPPPNRARMDYTGRSAWFAMDDEGGAVAARP